jgi:hypothetical protein
MFPAPKMKRAHLTVYSRFAQLCIAVLRKSDLPLFIFAIQVKHSLPIDDFGEPENHYIVNPSPKRKFFHLRLFWKPNTPKGCQKNTIKNSVSSIMEKTIFARTVIIYAYGLRNNED